MLKDRDQKQKALKLAVANRWFPQLEVDVHSDKAVDQDTNLATDLDVFASVPDVFKGFRAVVFDCKTKAKESPVNRAFWLSGVLKRMHADHGFCILKKDKLSADHCLMAGRLNVVLLMEDEFDLYAAATCPRYATTVGNTTDIGNWDKLFAIPQRAAPLEPCLRFLRCYYWMIDDAAEACRKTLASLKAHSAEFDPTKPEHVTIFFEYCSLFARSLAILVCDIFKLYLQPKQQQTLSEALLVMLYGGREAYEYRNDLYRLVLQRKADSSTPIPDLALPEWDRFLQLTRQLLDAPTESQRVPLIMREVGFSVLVGDTKMDFARTLCAESPQGARFAVLITDYLARAAKLPPEFSKSADNLLLPLQPTK
jgi:hypothetical protein